MASCKDCMCYEILCQHTLQDDELKPCKSFKNKSDFVEVVLGLRSAMQKFFVADLAF